MQETRQTTHANEHFSALLFAGDWKGARAEALKGAALADVADGRLRWLSDVALAEWAGGMSELALDTLDAAHSLYTASRNDEHCGAYENARGCILEALGRLPEALAWYRQSLNHFQAAQFKWGVAALYNNVGHVLTGLHRADEALEHLKLAESLYEELNDKARLVDVTDSLLKARRLAAGGEV